MDELTHLKSMWGSKVKRATKLIVPLISYEDGEGSLNNESWLFNVPYSFREALDIRYEERKRNKKPYMIWTQGPSIYFKEGDIVHSRNGKKSLQVTASDQMGWDDSKSEMYHGKVVYSEFTSTSKSKDADKTCTQMEFLQLLIYGEQKI